MRLGEKVKCCRNMKALARWVHAMVVLCLQGASRLTSSASSLTSGGLVSTLTPQPIRVTSVPLGINSPYFVPKRWAPAHLEDAALDHYHVRFEPIKLGSAPQPPIPAGAEPIEHGYSRPLNAPSQPQELSDPTGICCAVVRACLEAIAGHRPLTQLQRWLSPQVYRQMSDQMRLRVHTSQSHRAPALSSQAQEKAQEQSRAQTTRPSGLAAAGQRASQQAIGGQPDNEGQPVRGCHERTSKHEGNYLQAGPASQRNHKSHTDQPSSRKPVVVKRARLDRRGPIAEAAVVVSDQGRTRGVAVRLEVWRNSWKVTSMEIG